MANTQQIENPALPELPISGVVYSGQLVNQTNGVLRTFFTRVTSNLRALFGPRGGQYLNTPYGSFQDSTDQTAASATAAYPITFNTTDFTNGVTLSNSSRLNVTQSGLYNVQFSIQFKNTTNDTQDTDVWFRKNGTDVANSSSRFGLGPRKASTDPTHMIGSLNFFIDLNSGDYIQLMWCVSNVGVSIEHCPSGSSPTRPAVPSVIATMSFVSNIYA
jgi:hypothetical protein